MNFGICPFFSSPQEDRLCKGAYCALAVIENDEFKCCAIVEIANKGKKPEDQTTVK